MQKLLKPMRNQQFLPNFSGLGKSFSGLANCFSEFPGWIFGISGTAPPEAPQKQPKISRSTPEKSKTL
jgi:hypothetical protein